MILFDLSEEKIVAVAIDEYATFLWQKSGEFFGSPRVTRDRSLDYRVCDGFDCSDW